MACRERPAKIRWTEADGTEHLLECIEEDEVDRVVAWLLFSRYLLALVVGTIHIVH